MQSTVNLQDIDYYFTFKHVPSRKVPHALDYTPIEISPEDAAKQLYELLLKATEKLLEQADTIITLLSGGLDSSTTLHLIKECTAEKVVALTLGYNEIQWDGKTEDEAMARMVAARYGVDHYMRIVNPSDLLDDMPRILGCIDNPFSGVVSSAFVNSFLNCWLDEDDLETFFTGDVSDELFGSYRPHREACHHENDMAEWRHSLYVFQKKHKKLLYSDKMMEGWNPDATINYVKDKIDSSLDPTTQMLDYEWKTTLPDEVLVCPKSLLPYMDDLSPFMDEDVQRFVASLPANYKLSGTAEPLWLKRVLSMAMEGKLPRQVLYRKKEGFVQPSNYWLYHKWEKPVRQALARMDNHGLWNREYVNALLDKYYGGDESLVYKVWNLYCFQVWWDTCVEL